MRCPFRGQTALALLFGAAAGLIPGLVPGPGLLGAASAQVLQGSVLSARVSQSFEADTNFDLDDPSPGTSYFADTRLEMALLNETPDQAFELGFDTGLRALWRAERAFEFVTASPTTASLGYGRDWASGGFDSEFRWRQTQVDFDRPLSDFIDPTTGEIDVPDDLDQQTGDTLERRFDATLGLDLATDAPSSYAFDLRATNFNYSDPDANRTPRTTVDGSAAWALRLTPVLSSGVLGSFYYYTADNDTETEIQEAEIDAGVIYEPSDVFRLTGGIGYGKRTQDQITDLDTGQRETVQDNSGPLVRGTLNYAFEDVVVNAALRITTAAPDTRIDGNIRAIYPLPRGRVTGRLYQRYTGNSRGDEVRITGAGIGLVREINTVSRLGLDFAAAIQENQDDPEQGDIHRFDASAVYSYDITEVISADIGYRFRNRIEDDPDDREDATSNAIFFEIGRTFETMP